jgi:hypothetical protein
MEHGMQPQRRENFADRFVIDHLTSRSFARAKRSGRPISEEQKRALQEALAKRWSSASGGGLADF